ncbi:nucleotidyltransferase family protein [Sporosarcina sp. FSL W8-0480]|uniref:nucleotidyltransferase family protein n=1 Tax=Sporosarcina sp. FSL W8-0480 TaxID=2954701 RepID=UPI0030D9E5F4
MLVLSKDLILQELSNHLPMLSTKYGVKRIGLFGSYASGHQTVKSDMDILVEFKGTPITFDRYMELKFFLEDTFALPVDLVINDDVKPGLRPYIMENIMYA